MTPLQEIILRSPDPFAAARDVGKMIAESRMFGVQTPQQGVVILLTCMDKNIPLLDWAAEFHLMEIKGKVVPTMKADAMLARFEREGGHHAWVADGSDLNAAVLLLRKDDREQTIRFTMDEAKRAQLVVAGGNWTKWPQAMLRARVTTSGLRMFSPATISGISSAEELDDLGAVNITGGSVFEGSPQAVEPQSQQDATTSTDKPKRGRPAKAKSEESGAADGAGASDASRPASEAMTTATIAAPVAVAVGVDVTSAGAAVSPPTPVVTPSADTAKPAVDEARFAQVQWIERMKAKFFALTPDVLKGMGVPDDNINGITLNDQKWKPIETGAGTSVIAEMKQDDLNGLENLLKTRLERLRPFEDSKDLEAFADRLAQGK